MDVDKYLEKLGLKYEDLTAAERETYNSWLKAVQQNNLTLEKVKDYVISLRESVTQELTKHDLSDKQDLFLKARLRNLTLLESMLSGPERAKKALEQMVGGR